MKTPFKLKREAPSTLSTLDRTVLLSNRSSLRPQPLPPPAPLSQPLFKVPVPMENERVDTSQLERVMSRMVQEEDGRSERRRSAAKGGHCYFTRPVQSKLAVGATWPVPQRVKELYDREAKGGKCEFSRGILPRAGLYYFAVRKRVLFYDIARAIQSAGRLEDSFTHEAEFDATVYELKELSWKHAFFGEFRNRPIVLVSQAWKLSFAVLQIEPGQGRGVRWMRITALNTTFNHGASIARCIVERKYQIYFLDDSGKISKVSIEPSGWTDRLFDTTSRHKMRQNSNRLDFETSSLYTRRKAPLLERLRHYSKVFFAKSFSFYGQRIENHDLVSDNKGNLLFSLINLDANSDPTALSTFKLLTCWDKKGGKLRKRWEVSELEFFDKEVESIADHPDPYNYRIARIHSIDHHYDSQCSLMVVLNCGMRLYIKAEDSWKVVHYHIPPALDGPINRKAEPKEHSKTLQLLHCLSQWNTSIITLKEQQGDSHTFVVSRPTQTRQREECVELVWGNSMCRGKAGNPPEESHLTRISLTSPIKEKLALALASPVQHEMTRGLFNLPEFLIHSTDQGVEYLCQLRPIDRVFAAILSKLQDEHVFLKVLKGISQMELQCLLLQIYCDPNGQYLKDLQFIDCITQYQRILQTQGGQDFDPFQKDFYEQMKAQNKQRQDVLPIVVDREAVTAQVQGRLLAMILRLAKKTQGVGEHSKIEAEIHASLCNAILLYLAKLLKKIWRTNIKQLPSDIQLVLPMIQPLHNVISYFSTSINSKTKLIQHSVPMNKPLLRYGREKEEEEKDKKRQGKGLKEMTSYLGKVIQLVTLCSQVHIDLDKPFSLALSLDAQSYEKTIFDFLIDKYERPAISLLEYKKRFPYLIGEYLQKSLKIYEQGKSKKNEEIVSILKYHRQIPIYLLQYYQSKGVLRPEDIKQIRGLSSLPKPEKQRIDYSNVKYNIDNCILELSKQGLPLSQRTLLILRVNTLLNHYLTRNDGRQDRFYRQRQEQLQQVKKKVAFQELMLEEYARVDRQLSSQVVMQLKTFLFEDDKLEQLQEDLGSDCLKIVFLLLFRRVEAGQESRRIILQCIERILGLDCKEAQAEGIVKKAIGYLQELRKRDRRIRWPNFNRLLKMIMKNAPSFPLDELIDLLSEGIRRKLKDKIADEALRLGQIITKQCGKQRMVEMGKQMSIPLISITLLEAGVEGSDINSYYEQWIRQFKGGEEGLLHSINLLFLTLRVQPRWEFLLSNFKAVCGKIDQPMGSILEQCCKKIAEASGWRDPFS